MRPPRRRTARATACITRRIVAASPTSLERNGRPAPSAASAVAILGPSSAGATPARNAAKRSSRSRAGRTLGFPTANLQLHDEQLVPANGIYAVRVRIAGEHVWRMGAMSIGVRPTFGGTVRTLEVHLLDWDGDLYGRNLTVAMIDWLRGEAKFDTLEALVAQMDADSARAREILRRTPPFLP